MRIFIVLLLLTLALPAHAQYSDSERLIQMEKKLNTLERAVYRGGDVAQPSGGGYVEDMSPQESAGVQVRITQLEEKISRLQGKIEELEHQLNQAASNSAPSYTPDYTGHVEPTPDWNSPSTTNPAYPAQSSSLITNPVQEAYDHAFAQLRQKQYASAAREFQNFVELYPSHVLTSNAYYWLGEAYYAQKEYDKASIQFMQGYKDFPSGSKAPDSLLKLALSLGNMEKPKDACTTLNRLKQEFPDMSIALRQRAEQEMHNFKCS